MSKQTINPEGTQENLPPPSSYEYQHVEGIPFCHLYHPTTSTEYRMDLAVLVPQGREVYQIDVPASHENNENTCCGEPTERLFLIVVRMRDHADPNHPAETKTYRFQSFFNGEGPSCHNKIGVRIVTDDNEAGKTVIRTIDADSYEG